MPGPVSLTVNSSLPSAWRNQATVTPPCSVNFTAFPNRLSRIWRNRPASPMTQDGVSRGGGSIVTRSRLSAASGETIA
jgi:hypothetical protein